MSKYIIEIPDDTRRIWIDVFGEGYCYTQAEGVDDLEELNSDYINEHYGELQDEAYQAGMDKAWEVAQKIMNMPDPPYWDVFCEYKNELFKKLSASEAIAKLKAYEDKHSDRIEVGDEVNWLGDCFIVTRIFQPRNMKEQCDGIDDDGSAYHDILMEDLKKTGKHYDIQSILEAMRTHD